MNCTVSHPCNLLHFFITYHMQYNQFYDNHLTYSVLLLVSYICDICDCTVSFTCDYVAPMMARKWAESSYHGSVCSV